MKFSRQSFVVSLLWLLAVFAVVGMAFADGQSTPQDPAPKVETQPAHSVPVLTTEQKLEVRDLQAKDGEVTAAILQTQIQATQRMQQLNDQKKNYEDTLNKAIAGLCKSKDGKQYQFNSADLTCVAAPEQPKPPAKK